MKIVNIKNGPKCKYLYIGRKNKSYNQEESIFHNPFIIGQHGNRKEVIEKFKNYAVTNKKLMDSLYLLDKEEFLGCYCNFPNEDCHGRILMELREKQKKISQSLGIVGSAGRKEDKYRLTFAHYELMIEKSLKLLQVLKDKNINVTRLVSGGAAWSDQVAVHLFLSKVITELTLHLPCEFIFTLGRFEDNEIGKVMNHYHEAFSNVVQYSSLAEIRKAIEFGAKIVVTPGFSERNTEIAKDANILLAMTFGYKNQVKRGGTWNCCRKFLNLHPNNLSYHLDLGRKLVYKGILV